MKHTLAPWQIEYKPNMGRHYVHGVDNNAVCEMAHSRKTEENRANAFLIVAAPELLSACKVALAELSGINNGPECRILSQAIAKAEGAI